MDCYENGDKCHSINLGNHEDIAILRAFMRGIGYRGQMWSEPCVHFTSSAIIISVASFHQIHFRWFHPTRCIGVANCIIYNVTYRLFTHFQSVKDILYRYMCQGLELSGRDWILVTSVHTFSAEFLTPRTI